MNQSASEYEPVLWSINHQCLVLARSEQMGGTGDVRCSGGGSRDGLIVFVHLL